MAPLTSPSNSFSGQRTSQWAVSNTSRPPTTRLHDVEIIEIDDSDDEDGGTGGVNGDREEEQSEEMDEDEEIGEDDEEDEEDEYSSDVTGSSSVEEGSPEAEEDIQDIMTASSGPDLFTSNDLRDILYPLRRTAERVTGQIEAFANNLQKYRMKALQPGDRVIFREAYDLMRKYQEIAGKTAQHLSSTNAARKIKPSTITRKGGDQMPTAKPEEQIRRWELEGETWDLFKQLLEADGPEERERNRHAQETVLQLLHRYSTDQEVWEKFLEADHFALECYIVLKWLEESSRCSTQDLDALISELGIKAERGEGLWAHGWLYTKEAIKGAKRLRSWPQPLDPNDPGITTSLLSSEKKQPLITQLDPDAVTRQRNSLQAQDQFFEQATWLECWNMLRQGKSWDEIRKWSEAHLETWRSVSLCGSMKNSSANAGATNDAYFSRVMNYKSQESWRATCAALANNASSGDFERAVYGLLSGELEPTWALCHCWSDYLYVYLNHLVLGRYRGFCKQLTRKISYSPSMDARFVPEPPAYDDLHNVLENLKRNEKTMNEARNPYRTIQAAIISKKFDAFFYHQASAVSMVFERRKDTSIVPRTPVTKVDDCNFIAANDHDSLRIISHLFLVLRSLGYLRTDQHFLDIASINVIGYIDLLKRSGKVDLIPLYASLLPERLTHTVLGKVLIDIVDPKEQQQRVSAMKYLKIDLTAVVASQWKWALAEALSREDTRKIRLQKGVVKQANGPGRLGPVKKGIVGKFVFVEDQRLIRSLGWHRHLAHPWPKICSQGAYLYKRFFAAGRLAAARELYNLIRITEIPLETLFPADEDGMTDAPTNGIVEPPSPVKGSPTKSPLKSATYHHRRRSSAPMEIGEEEKLMMRDYRIMADLEQLIAAFDALEMWADRLDEYERCVRIHHSGVKDPEEIRESKKALQSTLDRVTECVQPMCTDDWLTWYTDSYEGPETLEIKFIHATYLPEIILAYHNTLYFAGHIIGREILTHCMDLANVVAESGSLTAAFVSASRMCELMDSFALSSMALMSAKDVKIKKKLPHHATMDIWKVRPAQESGD